MSVISSRPALRWLVPAAAAVAVIGGGAAVGRFAASAEPSLPERSAAQLLVDLQTARLDGLSGTVVQRADLGLPELPSLVEQGGLGLGSLLAGSNTLRVWYNGPEQVRIALVDTLGETDVIRNGRDAWLWQSRDNSAQHYRLPAVDAEHADPTLSPAHLPVTPKEAADIALRAIEPTTEVTTGRNAQVAGRDVYELILSPRDKGSLLGQVRLGIDATEHLPLRVEIFAKGADEPSFEVAFTQISFDRPDAERFRFNPPPGAKVEEKTVEPTAEQAKAEAKEMARKAHEQGAGTTVVGQGWTSVLVARLSDGTAGPLPGAGAAQGEHAEQADQALAILDRFRKVSGTWGSGRLLSSNLFSALLTDDGRVLIGAVTPERLYEVAGSPQGQVK